MKATAFLVFVCCFSAAFSAHRFVTPEMMLRNGLTDAQYEALWAAGRNPRIDRQAARDWVFRASRYENTTNWFGLIGKTNDFARMAHYYAETNIHLEAENKDLKQTVDRQTSQIGMLTNSVALLEEDLKTASRENWELSQEMTNGLYAIEKTDRFYEEREKTAPDEKIKFIYHEMREYLSIIKIEFQTPPNHE